MQTWKLRFYSYFEPPASINIIIYAIFTSYGIKYSEVVTAHIIDLMQFITNNHIKNPSIIHGMSLGDGEAAEIY